MMRFESAGSAAGMGRPILLALLLGGVWPQPVSPQWEASAYVQARVQTARVVVLSQQVIPPATMGTTNSVLIAAVGSALGIFAGGFLGYTVDRARDVPSEDPGLGGLIFGSLAGSALLSPTLLYVANGHRGPFGRALMLSIAGTTVAAAAFWNAEPFLIVVPAVQIGISVALLR
jgi:hypothetical protein